MKRLDWIFGVGYSMLLSLWITATGAGGAAPPADGDGGLAGLSAEDVEALRQAREALRRIVADAREHHTVRRDAAIALGRVHEALNDWGRAGQLEWYVGQIQQNPPEAVQAALAIDAQAAAKARQHHFGGVHEFWRKLEGLTRSQKMRLARETERARGAFRDCVTYLAKKGGAPPPLKTWKLTIPSLDVRSLLKPVDEPKEKR
jgi:hypothetical protein